MAVSLVGGSVYVQSSGTISAYRSGIYECSWRGHRQVQRRHHFDPPLRHFCVFSVNGGTVNVTSHGNINVYGTGILPPAAPPSPSTTPATSPQPREKVFMRVHLPVATRLSIKPAISKATSRCDLIMAAMQRRRVPAPLTHTRTLLPSLLLGMAERQLIPPATSPPLTTLASMRTQSSALSRDQQRHHQVILCRHFC